VAATGSADSLLTPLTVCGTVCGLWLAAHSGEKQFAAGSCAFQVVGAPVGGVHQACFRQVEPVEEPATASRLRDATGGEAFLYLSSWAATTAAGFVSPRW
jgi:hypothetical protein